MSVAANGLRRTPFEPRTASLCQSQAWRRWAGYLSAISYELTHDREYAAVRSAAALFDVTPLKKYLVDGPDAVRLLDRVVTRDMTRCKVGQVVYTGWCNSAGKLLDDGTVARLEENRFRLTSAEPNLRWLQQNAVGLDVDIRDVTHGTAALALQGPTSRRILQEVFEGPDLEGLRFFRIAAGTLAGAAVTVSRTGYTGDLGYEIWTDAEDALVVWDGLMHHGERHGIVPAGLSALDVARIEAGFMLLGVDYVSAYHALVESQTSSPLEMGLGWTVHLDGAAFVGRRALEAEKARGSAWQFVGVELDWGSLEQTYMEFGLRPKLPIEAWRVSHPLYARGRQIGYATSGCWSPLLKKYITLAHVESPHAAAGTAVEIELKVEHRPRRVHARVARRPFFDPDRKRA